MPYGEKTKEQLLEYSSKAFEFFETQGVKAVIMACNTTSAMVYEDLKDKYNFKLYPLIQSVSKILSQMPVSKIGVFATPATISSHAYSNNIKKYNTNIEITEIACPEWVKIVENNLIQTPEAADSVKIKVDEMLKYNVEKIVLGCTHYPYLINLLSKFSNKNLYINPAKDFVQYIKTDLLSNGLTNCNNTKGYDKFFVSGSPEKFISAAKMFYNVIECNVLK